jgi:hypothetical protein
MTSKGKYFKSKKWKELFSSWSAKFTDHKNNIRLTLEIRANVKLNAIDKSLSTVTAEVQTSTDMTAMSILFDILRSPKEQDLMRWIEQRGGAAAVIKSDDLLKNLVEYSRKIGFAEELKPLGGNDDNIKRGEDDMKLLMDTARAEWRTDLDEVLKKAEINFGQMFANQGKLVVKEADRVINTMLSGPHPDNPDLKAIWEEMVSHIGRVHNSQY